MWIVFGMVSVLSLAVNWAFTISGNQKRSWAMACSLAFTSLTLLMEYQMVQMWVVKEDWSALLDVVPSMHTILTGYVIVMVIGNILPLFYKKKACKREG